ncbi:MAG: hypothetical protein BGN86_11695 [Caulobacterales bacterium 68-7]|nr:MAG: hypothetical protein BGN86_11695 [Caulobacterales bacterium 68-7]
MTETPPSDDIAAKLIALREHLTAQVWATASAAAQTQDHERVRDLVKLKVDIEAIDFALSHRPAERR